MDVSEYRVGNFKAFGDTVRIPIRPITLLFGANSSGKSSIIQSLLLLNQTLGTLGGLEEPMFNGWIDDSDFPMAPLKSDGPVIELGPYSEFVHRHETDRAIEFGARIDWQALYFSLDLSYPCPAWKEICESTGIANGTIILSTKYALRDGKYVRREEVFIGDDKIPVLTRELVEGAIPDDWYTANINLDSQYWKVWWKALSQRLDTSSATKSKRDASEIKEIVKNYEDAIRFLRTYNYVRGVGSRFRESVLGNEQLRDKRNREDRGLDEVRNWEKGISIAGKLYRLLNGTKFTHEDMAGEFAQIGAYFDFAVNFILFANRGFRTLFQSLSYLGPLRERPQRYYTFEGKHYFSVGTMGENLPYLLFESQEHLDKINNELNSIGINYNLRIDNLRHDDGRASNIFSLLLQNKDSGVVANVRDVGFGIGQVLPIIVQTWIGGVHPLLIEQPEIHLHPAHQAELGDMFIRSAIELNRKFIIETHSEHLMLRILRRIRETTDGELPEGFPSIRPQDVAVLYVQPGEKGASVIQLPTTEDGDFAMTWPGGFFAERAKELF